LAVAGNELVAAYIKADKIAEATRVLQEQLNIARKELKPDGIQLAGALAYTGNRLLALKQYTAAEPIMRECLTLREKLAESKQVLPWQVANAKSMLGGALLGQKKYADAEPLLRAGYEGLKKDEKAMPPQAKENIRDALKRLIQLYEATDKNDEAAKWKAKLAQESSQ
jgi:hypothetical protein